MESAADGSDFNRCLAERGIHKAEQIANALSKELSTPDMMISSPACRALETARIFAEAVNFPLDQIEAREALYHFGGINRVLKIITQTDVSVTRLLLFGHNPTFNVLAWHLCPQFRNNLPTSAVVALSFPMDKWTDIGKHPGHLECYLTHRLLE